MAVLLAVYTSDGCVGRCDARCYNAHSTHCKCICKGLNHGAGLRKARSQTRELAQKWIDEYQDAFDEPLKPVLHADVEVKSLFEIAEDAETQ